MNIVHESQLPPPVPTPNGGDKIWAILCHLSSFIGVGFILPLVVYLAMKGESEYVRSNAREALNFHISVLIYMLCCIPLAMTVVAIPIAIAIAGFAVIGSLILSIIAAIKASDNGCYQYPLTLRLIK